MAADCDLWNTQEFFETATLEAVTACLDDYADPNARDTEARLPYHTVTPLYFAIEFSDDSAVIGALLAAGADPNMRSKYYETSIERAARSNEDPAVIEALVAAGADPSVRVHTTNSTPLHLAALRNGNPAVIEALVAAGADPNARGEQNRTPVSMAASDNGIPPSLKL